MPKLAPTIALRGILLTAALLFAVGCGPAASPGTSGTPTRPTEVPLTARPDSDQNQPAPEHGTVATDTPVALTEEQLGTKAAFGERMGKGIPLLNAFQEADTGRWEINPYAREDDFLTVSIGDPNTSIKIECATDTGKLMVSFVRNWTKREQTDINLRFHGGAGEEVIKHLGWIHNNARWLGGPPVYSGSPGAVILRMNADGSQAIIDGLLLAGVSGLDVEYGRHNGEEGEHTFDTAGFRAVHDVLADHCRPPEDEVQARVAASVLTPPTPTPTPRPTSTPVDKSWQQEWCEEHDYPRYGLEGNYPAHGENKGEDTARLIVRCGDGTLVVGVHITRKDGAYPEPGSGIAYAFGFTKAEIAYRLSADGWEQLQGNTAGGGVFYIAPESVAKHVLEVRAKKRNPNTPFLSLWILFGALEDDPRISDATRQTVDVEVRIKRGAKRHSLD